MKAQWYTITINYIYSDGQQSQYKDRVLGQKQIQKQVDYATTWLTNHNRQIVGDPIIQAEA